MTNYYDVLGVNVFANQREIKDKYKKLAIQFHPDKHGGNIEFEEKFKAINEAFQVLSNPALRNRYDHKMFYSQPVQSAQNATVHTTRSVNNTRYSQPKVARVTYSRKQYVLATLLFLGLLLGATALFFGMSKYASNKYFEEGEAMYKKESYDLALAKYMEVLEVDPNHAQANERMGDLAIERMGNTEMGLAFYENAIKNNKQPLPQLILKKCKALIVEKRSDEAKQQLVAMLVSYPTNSQAWCMLGEIFFWENEYENAWNAYQKANNQSSGTECMYGSALAAYQLGKYTKTIEYCTLLLETDKTDAASIMLRGKSFLLLGDSLKACQDFTKADMYNFPTAQTYKVSVCEDF